ncbi:hypothetical protein N0V86_009668 [Didymella sp. IMI 355093]|nr:hypothetical protein N0V86_009668 [Didymella sp. IMI 355093]
MLHWLLSQTFFLVRIDVYDGKGSLITAGSRITDIDIENPSRSACGVSSSSFVVFFVAFLGLCIAVRMLASRKLVTGLPQAVSNSLVISAAPEHHSAIYFPVDEVGLRFVWLQYDPSQIREVSHASLAHFTQLGLPTHNVVHQPLIVNAALSK